MKTQSESQITNDTFNIGQHPWRKCPLGKHLVREHMIHVPNSKIHPAGMMSNGMNTVQ